MPLIGNGLRPLAKSALLPLGLTAEAAAAAIDETIQKKTYGSGTTTLIISNEEMKDIMEIVKSFEESGLLIKGVSETIKNEAKEKKWGFCGMLLGTLGPSLLENLLKSRNLSRRRHN